MMWFNWNSIYGVYHDWTDTSKIRLFYMGKELENDVWIANYDIKPEIYLWGLIMDED